MTSEIENPSQEPGPLVDYYYVEYLAQNHPRLLARFEPGCWERPEYREWRNPPLVQADCSSYKVIDRLDPDPWDPTVKVDA